ncbi:MAG: DUF6069 family protein [Nocardioides sp.]
MHSSVLVRHGSAVVGATAAAALVYVLGRHGLDIRIEAATVDPPRVTLGSVLVVSSMASALGWALLAALERWTTRGRSLWIRIAVVVTLLSLLGPLTAPDMTGGGRVLLTLLHLVVGVVTIGVLASTSDPVSDRSRGSTYEGAR